MNPRSIASYSFHGLLAQGRMDIFGYLESCRYRYRLDTADIWNGFLPALEEAYLQKIKAALDGLGLTLVNLCVDGAHVWDDDGAVREKCRANAWDYLRAGAFLGAQTVRFDVGVRDETMSDAQLESVAEQYRGYCDFARDHGFRVGPENHWGAAKYPREMLRLAAAVDHPSFGILLHLGGWLGPDAESGDAMTAALAMHTHFPAGPCADALRYVSVMMDADYRGCFGIEHHSGRNEHTEAAWQLISVERAQTHYRDGVRVLHHDENPLLPR